MNRKACSEAEWTCRVELAAAYHLVELNGWGESIFNHIAARVPDQPTQMLIKRHDLLYREVTASNLVKVSIEDNLNESSGVNAAGYVMHAGVMLGRSDVKAGLHFHTPEILAVGMQPRGLRMLSIYAVQFYGRIGYHDFHGVADDLAERPHLLKQLADNRALILRNHGALVVGGSVGQTFISARYLWEACRVQVLAQAASAELIELPESVCRTAVETFKRHDTGRAGDDWPSYLRDLDTRSPSYKN